MDTMIHKAAILMVLVAVAAPLPAQINSSAASVTLRARVEEAVSVRAYPISVAEAGGNGAQLHPVALHVLLDWRLQNARTFRVGYGLDEDDGTSSQTCQAGFFSLRQLRAKAAAFSFLSSSSGSPAVLGVWGDANGDPTGLASFLLGVPSGDAATMGTVRITIAVF